MLNYNLLLGDLLRQATSTALEEAITNQFSAIAIKEQLKETHQYERLPLLWPFLNNSSNSYLLVEVVVDLLQEICIEELSERKERLLVIFRDTVKYLGPLLSHRKVNFLCGKQGLPLIVLQYLHPITDESGYTGGIVFTDNLDLFLQLPLHRQKVKFCIYYNARKIMDHFMCRQEACAQFCQDAIEYKDLEDIRFLLAYPDTRHYLVETMMWVYSREEMEFVALILKEKLIVFDQEEWTKLKSENKDLYEYFALDV